MSTATADHETGRTIGGSFARPRRARASTQAQRRARVDTIAERTLEWASDPSTPAAEVLRMWRQVEWAMLRLGATDGAPIWSAIGRKGLPRARPEGTAAPATIPSPDPLAAPTETLASTPPDPAA